MVNLPDTRTEDAKVPVSVIVLTKDEERNIGICLDSLAWADEVIVFDSYSSDRTVDIAREKGASVVARKFDNFAAHKNWAIDNLDLRHDWIFFVDADERGTPLLAEETRQVVSDPLSRNGYYVAGENWLWGKPMRAIYPNFNLRLIRRGKGRYEDRIVHEHMVIEGPAGYLKNHLVHMDDKGIERWYDRHNNYSSMEAVEAWRLLNAHEKESSITARITARGPERRRALKQFAYRYLPARPIWQFLYLYIVKRGILDGRRGFRYCVLKMFYEYQVSLKIEELNDPDSPMSEKYRHLLNR